MQSNFNPPKFLSFDDLLLSIYTNLLNRKTIIEGKRGQIREILNFSATLENPRSRISHSLDRRLVRSKFAELAWYFSMDSDLKYIRPYINAYADEEADSNKILGAYGPKIFEPRENESSQFTRVIEQIQTRESTKQAYLVISDSNDYKVRINKHSSPPCTIGLHFIVRSGALHLATYMRSNDAYLGLPHDLFAFTTLQEIIAIMTGKELGTYTHVCTSLHTYESQVDKLVNYVDEGYQEMIEMPPIKTCSQEIMNQVSKAYNNSIDHYEMQSLDEYWSDFILFADRYFKDADQEEWVTQFKMEEFRKIAFNSIND